MGRNLRLTAAAEAAVMVALEERVEDLHEDSGDRKLTRRERSTAESDMKALVRVIEQLDDEHPFVQTPPVAGRPYRFDEVLDAYYDEDEGPDDDEGDDDGDAPADEEGDTPPMPPATGARAAEVIDVDVVRP